MVIAIVICAWSSVPGGKHDVRFGNVCHRPAMAGLIARRVKWHGSIYSCKHCANTLEPIQVFDLWSFQVIRGAPRSAPRPLGASKAGFPDSECETVSGVREDFFKAGIDGRGSLAAERTAHPLKFPVVRPDEYY